MIEWAFQKEFGVDGKDEIAEFSMFDGDTLWRCVVYCVAGNTKRCTNRVGVSVDAGMHVTIRSVRTGSSPIERGSIFRMETRQRKDRNNQIKPEGNKQNKAFD